MRWFQVLRLVIAAGILLSLGHVAIREVAEPGDRLHAFIYHRGPLQHVILGVAALALVMLYSRCRQYAQNAARFRRFERKQGDPPGPLAEALRRVGRFCADYGPGAARTQVERFAEDQSTAVQREYEAVGHPIVSLPFLGLVGTLLGLSDALFDAFSNGFSPESVEQFVAGLSTALDTTVLAMLCAAPLFAWADFQSRAENRLVERYVDFLRERFGLADIPEGDRGTYLIQAELGKLTKRIGQDAKATFAELLDTSAAALRETLGQAVQKHFDELHDREPEVLRLVCREIAGQVNMAVGSIPEVLGLQNRELAEQLTLAATENVARPVQAAAKEIQDRLLRLGEQLPGELSRTLGDSLVRATELVDTRNASLADRMTHQMGRLETALRKRTPEEVIIRYHGNGAAHRGA